MQAVRALTNAIGNNVTRTAIVTRAVLAVICAAVAMPCLGAAPPDAVIEVWEQTWTLNADGSSVYHFKQHVRLNSDRAYHEFADPRITYNVKTDELEIVNARVKRADGTYCELPDYAQVKAGPGPSAGWPAFADIHQHVIVMSGIEPGCVVELEYKITTQPGALPYLAADVRLHHHYPVAERTVAVETPADVPVRWTATGKVFDRARLPDELGRVSLQDLPAMPDEPQSPPWRVCCARIAFSTAPSADAWVRSALDRIDTAADESPLIARLATEWTEDCFNDSDRLRAIHDKLAATFSFVEFDRSWLRGLPRAASETLRTSHGSAEEAAAVFLSLARAAGVPVNPALLVNDDTWTDEAPQRGFVAAYALLLEADGGQEVWDAHHGRLTRDDRWAGHTLLAVSGDQLQRTAWPAWSNADASRCRVAGTIKLADDGTFSGDLSLVTTGLFVSPERLRSTAAQKSRVTTLVQHVLPAAKVESFNVTTLGREFAVEARVKSAEALKKISGSYLLQLAENGPFQANISLPLNYSTRHNPVWLTGAFDEQIELTIEWPEGWELEARPRALERQSGSWGVIAQEVDPGDGSLKIARHTRITQRELSPDDFLKIRPALNELRTEAARTLLLRP